MPVAQNIIRFTAARATSTPGTWTPIRWDANGMPDKFVLRCPECGHAQEIDVTAGRYTVKMGMISPSVLCAAGTSCRWAALASLDHWPMYTNKGPPTPRFGDKDPWVGAQIVQQSAAADGGDQLQHRFMFPARDADEYGHAMTMANILHAHGWRVCVQTFRACLHVRIFITKNDDIHEAAALRLARLATWDMEEAGVQLPEWGHDEYANRV